MQLYTHNLEPGGMQSTCLYCLYIFLGWLFGRESQLSPISAVRDEGKVDEHFQSLDQVGTMTFIRSQEHWRDLIWEG